MSFNKNNKLEFKNILFILTFFLFFFIPVERYVYSGAIAGNTGEDNIYLWNVLFYAL